MSNSRKLHPDLAKKAREELGEDPNRLEADIMALRAWIVQQPHLNNSVRTNDQWLANYLRGCKFSLEKTKKKIDAFYSLRSTLPELVQGLNPFSPLIQKFLDLGIYLPLPKTLKPDDPRLIIVRVGLFESAAKNFDEVLYLCQLFSLYWMHEDDQAVIAGFTFLMDIGGTTVNIVNHFTLQNLRKIKYLNEEALPMRHKNAHYVNSPPGAETFYAFIKTFMSDEIRKRFFVHSSMEEVYEHIPRKLLPVEYGGEDFTIQDIIDDTKKKMENFSDWFAEDRMYKSNESMRQGKVKTADMLFGSEGSFRKLCVD